MTRKLLQKRHFARLEVRQGERSAGSRRKLRTIRRREHRPVGLRNHRLHRTPVKFDRAQKCRQSLERNGRGKNELVITRCARRSNHRPLVGRVNIRLGPKHR
jgi:hypothetical protein